MTPGGRESRRAQQLEISSLDRLVSPLRLASHNPRLFFLFDQPAISGPIVTSPLFQFPGDCLARHFACSSGLLAPSRLLPVPAGTDRIQGDDPVLR